MPSWISSGVSSEFSRLMIGRSCRPTPTPWPNCSPNASISSANPNSSACGHTFAIWSVVVPGSHEVDRGVHPFPRLLERVALRLARAAHHERAVVAGPVAVEDVDDVEVGLIARADQPVAEHVRVRAAAFAGDRVDRLDELRAHAEQARVRHADHVGLAHPRLQHLEDVLIYAVDHRARLRQQHDLVGALDLAGVHHGLLAVDHPSRRPEREEHGGLGEVDAELVLGDPRVLEGALDLAHGARVQPGLRTDRALQPGVAADRVLLVVEVGQLQPVRLRRRAEVPDFGRSFRVISAQRSPLLNAQ